jgi:hypothetical protein
VSWDEIWLKSWTVSWPESWRVIWDPIWVPRGWGTSRKPAPFSEKCRINNCKVMYEQTT